MIDSRLDRGTVEYALSGRAGRARAVPCHSVCLGRHVRVFSDVGNTLVGSAGTEDVRALVLSAWPIWPGAG